MSNENARRSAAGPFSASTSAIPPPPPLPAPRPLQRAREAATRFFGYASRSASPQRTPEEDRNARSGRARFASLSAQQNATVSHRTGMEIRTLSINEKGTHALIGGKNIFKTVRVEDGSCVEDFNLRSVIRSNPTHALSQPWEKNIDIADVAWAKGGCEKYVAAATSSGKILLCDLGHAGLPAATLHEHQRQVHRLTFNPHHGSLLLSGSQDGTVRLWDVRDATHAQTLRSRRKYSGQSDGVRDVKWSPTDGVDFAFGTDSGWVQRWDMRNLKTAKVRIAAHSETCNSIDWHPDGKHIASASSDKTVRVWDTSAAQRPQKPSWMITTPYRVSNARWRPPCESSNAANNGARLCTQLVTAYDTDVLHIWDFRRPLMPFREMFPHQTAPTDLLWHSQDLLWTVGKEGVFLQTDIQHAPKVINKRNLQAFALSPQNEITFVTQKRPQLTLPQSTRAAHPTSNMSTTQGESAEGGALSRSWTDDGLDHIFLNRPQAKPSGRPPPAAAKGKGNVVAVGPRNDMVFTVTLPLDEALKGADELRPRQVMWYGHMPTAPDPQIFAFLAQHYVIDLKTVPIDDSFLDSITNLMNHNAACALAAGMNRTAKTWRIIGYLLTIYLQKRAANRAKLEQEGRKPENQPEEGRLSLTEIARALMNEQSKSPTPTQASLKPVSAITQQLALSDISSDQTTPHIHPESKKATADQTDADELPDLDKEDDLTLPPSLSPAFAQKPFDPSEEESKLTSDNLDDLQKLQQSTTGADKATMVRRWSAQNEPLDLENMEMDRTVRIEVPKLVRRASNESFTFLQEGSADSREHSFPSSFASSAPMDMVAERPSRRAPREGPPASRGVEVQDFDDRPITDTAQPTEKKHPDITAASSHVPTTEQAAETIKWIKDQDQKSEEETVTQEDMTSPFLPVDGEEDLEEEAFCTLIDMLRELVNIYANKGDAQNAAHLLLLIAPLLPRTHPLPEEEITQTVASYVDCYTSTGYTNEETESILEKHLAPLISAGLQPLQVEAILSGYHEQLMKRRLFNEAAILRRLSFPAFPAVYEHAMEGNSLRVRCGSCAKPIGAGMGLRCKNCRGKAGCPVCWSEDSPYEQPPSKLMTACLKCNHMAHAACLREFYADGEGGCPSEGCLCNCVA